MTPSTLPPSKGELILWACDQTAEELVNTYNRIPGVKQLGGKPADAFKSREDAAEKIWAACHPPVKAPKTAKKPAKAPAKAKVAPGAKTKPAKRTKGRKPAKGSKRVAPNGTSKKDHLLALISRKGGATLPELMKALGWLKHSVRGAVATLGQEHKIISEKIDGVRTYRLK
jgi:hypothetical protein